MWAELGGGGAVDVDFGQDRKKQRLAGVERTHYLDERHKIKTKLHLRKLDACQLEPVLHPPSQILIQHQGDQRVG